MNARRKRKLTKGEVAGIRLVADLYVIRDLMNNVFAKDESTAPHLKELEEALKKAVPDVFSAEAELQKQIEDARQVWIEELLQKNGFENNA